jgi:phosphoglycolate phosphatase
MTKFLLLFDLDGTLVDTLPDLTNALNEILRERAYPALTPAEVKPMIGDGMPMLLARGFAARGADAAEAKAAQPRFI